MKMLKKIFIGIVCAAFAAGSMAETIYEPAVSVRMESPKKIAAKLSDTLRKISKDPQDEMMLTIGLCALGYPSFHDIDPNADLAVFSFFPETQEDKPPVFLALKAGDESILAANLSNANYPKLRDGEFLFLDISTHFQEANEKSEIQKYLPSIKKAFANKSAARPLEIEISIKKSRAFLKKFLDERLKRKDISDEEKKEIDLAMALLEIAEEVDFISLSLDLQKSDISINFGLAAANESRLSKAFAATPNKSAIKEACFIPQKSSATFFMASSPEAISIVLEILKSAFAKNKDFANILEQAEKINRKSKGTGAGYVNFSTENTQEYATILQTKASFDELYEYNANSLAFANSAIKLLLKRIEDVDIDAKNLADIKKLKFSEVETLKEVCKKHPKLKNSYLIETSSPKDELQEETQNYYSFKVDDYLVTASSPKIILEILSKMKKPASSAKTIDSDFLMELRPFMFAPFRAFVMDDASAKTFKDAPPVRIESLGNEKKKELSLKVPHVFIEACLKIYKDALSKNAMQATPSL